MVKTEYYMQLFDLFDVCEAAKNTEALFLFFKIWRALLFANNVSLLEVVLNEDCVLRFFGALEYDPRVPAERYVRHREFLKDAKLLEVVPFTNDDLRVRIRQTYYIQYLRDVILAGVIDDGISSTINSFVIYNQMEIVSLIRRDPDILQNLLRQMQDPDVDDKAFLDRISFILELCNLGKMCNVSGRIELYSLLNSLGVFQVLELALRKGDCEIRALACEIVNLTIQHNASLLRGYVLNQSQKASFLLLLVDGIVSEGDLGLKSQFVGILQVLLDPEGMEKVNAKDQMLGIWYECCMTRLMEPLAAPLDQDIPSKEHVLELLEFCIRVHDFRVKYFILGNNITKRVVALTEHRDRFLQLAAVRLIRVLVGIRDSFFDRHLCRHHFLDPVVDLLVRNGGVNNLVDSAILDLIEFIRAAPIPELAREIVSRHRDTLLSIKYVSVCSQLVQMVDQWERETANGNGGPLATPPVPMESPSRKRGRGDGGNGLEDSWFEDDDPGFHKLGSMEEGSGSGSSGGGGGGVGGGGVDTPTPHAPPQLMMDYSILPPLPSTRLMEEEEGELPLLSRHDTPPMPDFQQQKNGGLSFASLRLPSEPGALVAGLAAEATRLAAESTTGGPYWGGMQGGQGENQNKPAAGDTGGDDEKHMEETKKRRIETSAAEETAAPPSMLDEFLKDSS
jgi:protein phosphatase-4 regulatory subunit 3